MLTSTSTANPDVWAPRRARWAATRQTWLCLISAQPIGSAACTPSPAAAACRGRAAGRPATAPLRLVPVDGGAQGPPSAAKALRHRPGPAYASMNEAAEVLGVTRDAARKRFQRAGQAVRIGGRHWITWDNVKALLPAGVAQHAVSTPEFARVRGTTTQAARKWLRRNGCAMKLGGRVVVDIGRLQRIAPDWAGLLRAAGEAKRT